MKSKTASNSSFTATKGPKKPLVSAKSKAVSLLARREHSQSELRAKLLQRGYSTDEVEQAIQWANSHQFQSDERFKLSLFRRRAPTFGDRAISAELVQHGLGDLKSMELTEEIDAPLDSEEERAYDWIKRRQHAGLQKLFGEEACSSPHDEMALKAKVFRGLSSRGFEFGNIDRAWRRILAEFKSNA